MWHIACVIVITDMGVLTRGLPLNGGQNSLSVKLPHSENMLLVQECFSVRSQIP